MQQDHTAQEIFTQVDAWNDAHEAVLKSRDALLALWQRHAFDYVIVIGCGSTYYLALTAATLLQEATGEIARAVPASELLFNPMAVYGHGRPLLIAISRSGTTSETVQAVREFKDRYQGDVIVISCYDDKPLNTFATLNLTARAGQEVGIAQTRSFSSMLIIAEGIARVLGEPTYHASAFTAATHQWVEAAHDLAATYANPGRFERVFYLGSGARYGLACEAMLKMKEMSLTSAEAFHTMEFRHGPKSMVDDKTLIVGLLDERHVESETAVIREMQALGGTTVTLATSEAISADIILPRYAERPSLVHMLPFLQWLAYLRAVNKGLNPDTPRNLDQVVIL